MADQEPQPVGITLEQLKEFAEEFERDTEGLGRFLETKADQISPQWAPVLKGYVGKGAVAAGIIKGFYNSASQARPAQTQPPTPQEQQAEQEATPAAEARPQQPQALYSGRRPAKAGKLFAYMGEMIKYGLLPDEAMEDFMKTYAGLVGYESLNAQQRSEVLKKAKEHVSIAKRLQLYWLRAVDGMVSDMHRSGLNPSLGR